MSANQIAADIATIIAMASPEDLEAALALLAGTETIRKLTKAMLYDDVIKEVVRRHARSEAESVDEGEAPLTPREGLMNVCEGLMDTVAVITEEIEDVFNEVAAEPEFKE
ncbi:hypothetical protein [Burkholderia phage BCSR129]|nr:hypothetical protein [Burkholderia phage BCSR129]